MPRGEIDWKEGAKSLLQQGSGMGRCHPLNCKWFLDQEHEVNLSTVQQWEGVSLFASEQGLRGPKTQAQPEEKERRNWSHQGADRVDDKHCLISNSVARIS